MPTIAPKGHDDDMDRGSPPTEPLILSIPDAERLLLQSRFVRNQVEAEILSDIEDRIRRATVLEPSAVPRDLVTINSRVVLREVNTCRQHLIVLAFPSCADSRKGRVSVLTPLGSILLGARVGQTLTCPISGLLTTVVVNAILRQPEAAGDYYG